ncbi:MAG TPA: hypothetical protein VMA72_21260 [Streptosporangiaceae bacterium]|nr:hypothetical protein [Streptosporangiaceae bacterium]
MRRFLRDCRRAATTRGLPSGVLVLAVLAGINTRRGVPLDILAAAAVAGLAWAVALPGYVLGRRLREARRHP